MHEETAAVPSVGCHRDTRRISTVGPKHRSGSKAAVRLIGANLDGDVAVNAMWASNPTHHNRGRLVAS